MCYEKRDLKIARACWERDQMKDDYISRKALLAEYDRVHVGAPGGARKLMEDAPAADVAPVVHGEWRRVTGDDGILTAECTECDAVFDDLSMFEFALNYNYCPNCGARMDGDGNG